MLMPTTAKSCVVALMAVVPLVVVAGPAHAATSASGIYANCKAYNKKYPHGVGKAHAKDHVSGSSKPVTTFKHSDALYKAAMAHKKDLDRDKDGVACEKR